jgi:hypothetical protein
MNHYEALEIKRDGERTGLWHYTRNSQPVGFCGDESCKGHVSPGEAREHYREYLISTIHITPNAVEWPKHKCKIDGCNHEATYLAKTLGNMPRYDMICKDHANAESVSTLISVGEWCSSSW